MMKAIEIAAPGGPEVLRLVERDAPVAGAGEALIRVAASGVNRPDVLQRKGVELARANRNLQVAEATVRRSERLAALGQLTAGLAHELRNPLGTIRASAEVLTRQLDSNPEVAREMSGYIRDEVDRMNSLISRFLDFARPLQPKLEPADVNEILDRALAELQRTAQQQPR